MNIAIEELTIQDFADVYNLWKREGLLVEEFDTEKKEYDLIINRNQHTCICFKMNGQIIGTSLGTFNGAWGWICRVAVDGTHQGKGYGKLLLYETEERLKQAGASKIMLSVNCANTQVVPFYEKLGFKEKDTSLFMFKRVA